MRPKRFYRQMTPEKAAEIRWLYFSRAGTQAEIAEQFGIRQHTVSRIVSGITWAKPVERDVAR